MVVVVVVVIVVVDVVVVVVETDVVVDDTVVVVDVDVVSVVDVAVVLVVEVVVVVVVVVVQVQESQRTGQCRLICVPKKLSRVQAERRYGSSRPHSSGSPSPLHTSVVVVVVPVVVVAVMVVVVVDATQWSQAIGQRAMRPGRVLHCVGVTPSQSGVGSGVPLGSAPLQSSQSVPDQGWSQLHVVERCGDVNC